MNSRKREETLADVGERGLLTRLFARLGVMGGDILVGPGDDAAVLAAAGEDAVVFTCDAMAEGIHFDLGIMTAEDVGWRLVAANVSDLAAMGASPWVGVIAMAVPGGTAAALVDRFYAGAVECARKFGLALVGGDVIASRGGLFFAMAALGRGCGREVLKRTGARPGDLLAVTGQVAAAQAGLDLLLAGKEIPPELVVGVNRYRRPEPRVAFARRLLEARLATAVIDTSDSLSESCHLLAEASGVGVVVDWPAVPVSPAARAVASRRGVSVEDYGLSAGEDFELLFTVARDKVNAVRSAADAATPVAVIGEIVAGPPRVTLLTAAGERPVEPRGFVHFGRF